MPKKYTPFTTSIWSTELNIDKSAHKQIIKYIYDMKRTDKGVSISNAGGWQSKSTNQTTQILNPLFEPMKEFTMGVLGDLNFAQEGYLPVIDNYWFNVNKKGDYNVAHDHAGSSLSGVVYLKVPPKAGGIAFDRTDTQTWAFPAATDYSKSGTSERCPTMVLEPKELEYIIFPSSLRHSVQPNMSSEDRISMAINFSLRKP